MKMRKLLLTCAAIASVSLAFSVSVFAETGTMLHNTASAPDLADATSGQMTVMVVKMENSTDDPIPSASNILYIDQVEYDTDIFQNMKLKDALKDDDYYAVKVGGQNVATAAETVFKVGKLVAGATVEGYDTFLASAPIKITDPANMKFKITKDGSGNKEAIVGSFASNITTTQEVIPVVGYKISSEGTNPVAKGDTFTLSLYDSVKNGSDGNPDLSTGTLVDTWTYQVPEQ